MAWSRVLKTRLSWEEIPKLLVTILIDLSELDLFVAQYRDELKQPEEADKIYDAYESNERLET